MRREGNNELYPLLSLIVGIVGMEFGGEESKSWADFAQSIL